MPYCTSVRICASVAVWLIAQVIVQSGAPIAQAQDTPETPSGLIVRASKWAALLDQQIIEARSLSEEARAEALASVANAYWELSPDKSKELFVAALESSFAIETESNRQPVLSRIIASAAKRDPQLARRLTQSLIENESGEKHAVSIAVDLLGSDTRTAEAMALSAVSFGVSADIAWLIFQLQARDPAAADRVYAAYLNSPNSKTLPKLLWLAGYPFGNGEAIGGATDPLQFTGTSGFRLKTLTANRALANAFLTIADQAIAAAITSLNGATPEQVEAVNSLVFFTVNYLLPETEKYRPDLYGRWAAYGVQSSQLVNPYHRSAILSKLQTILAARERARNQSTDMNTSSGTSESLEDTLEKTEKLAGSCQRDVVYAKASLNLSYRADFKRAMSVAEQISELNLQSNVIQLVHYDMAMSGAKAKASITIDEAVKYAHRVELPELRAWLLLKLSSRLSDEGRGVESNQLIHDATNIAERIADPSARASVFVAIEKQLPESNVEDRFKALKLAVGVLNSSKQIKIDQLSVWQRLDLSCEQNNNEWHGGRIATLNLIDGIVRFSQTREDEALQLAMQLDARVNRIRAVTAVAGSAIERIKTEETKKSTPAKRKTK